MRNTGSIEVRKLHPLFGAEVSGIDITRPLSAREFGPIRAAFEEHSVLLFRDQPMDDEKQIAFSENFGPLETTGSANPAAGTKFARQSNLDIMTGEPIPPDDMRMIYQKANYFWHSDLLLQAYPLALLGADGAHLPARRRQYRIPSACARHGMRCRLPCRRRSIRWSPSMRSPIRAIACRRES